MKIIKIAFVLLFIVHFSLNAQIRISGFVYDKLSGERLIGANVVDSGLVNGTVTDNNGYFSLVTKRATNLSVSYIGYKNKKINLINLKDTLIKVFLEQGQELDEVVVKTQRIQKFNVATLTASEIIQIPSLGGKPDVLKAMQLLPGIQTQNEGSALLLVRGGDPGQNLYLFDNVPVIYVNHLGGFTSVFNPEIINKIDVYKGGFPAKFGGRLSSVVDITQREGNASQVKGSLSIGLMDASFTLEGPLTKKNMSFIITGRKTTFDPLLFYLGKLAESDFLVTYGFYDLNGKLTWKPNEKNSLHFNFYEGDDYLIYRSSSDKNGSEQKGAANTIWGNWLISLKWNRVVSSKIFLTQNISFTRYRLKEKQSYTYSDDAITKDSKSEYIASVQDISYNSGLKYSVSQDWSMNMGMQSSYLVHIPNYGFESNQMEQPIKNAVQAFESVIYHDNKIVLFKRLEANPGIRLVMYSTSNLTNFSIEPRLNINLNVTEKNVLNFSYMKVSQNSHLLFTTGSITRSEIWIPSDNRIKPAYSEQYSLGWNSYLFGQVIETELNLYVKKMNSLSTFKEGYTNLKGDADWQSKIETDGKGESEGFELFIKKNSGKLTGAISYSFSKATREYHAINNGKEYPYEYNRTHSASININYQINKKLALNLLWLFQSGLPYTPAIGRQSAPALETDRNEIFFYDALIYGERNSATMKDYHRLDVGLNYTTLTKKRKRTAIWSFSIYNLYNRHNPYYYYYNDNNSGEIYRTDKSESNRPLSLFQISMFPIIPSISYKVIFDENYVKKTKTKKNTFKNWLYHEN
jgi:hypothetical protein